MSGKGEKAKVSNEARALEIARAFRARGYQAEVRRDKEGPHVVVVVPTVEAVRAAASKIAAQIINGIEETFKKEREHILSNMKKRKGVGT